MVKDESRSVSSRPVTRRSALHVLGGTSLVGLAGCIGDDDDVDDLNGDDDDPADDDPADDDTDDDDAEPDGPTEFVYRTGPSDSLHFAMANGMSAVIEQNSDYTLHLEASTAGQSLSELVRGEVDFAHFDLLMAQEAMEGEGDFAELDVDYTPLHVVSMYFIGSGFVVNTDRDIEYYNQLEGQRVIPGPPDAAFWFPLERALDHVLDLDAVDVRHGAPSQIPEDLSADAVDAGGGPLYINGVIPGYIEQMFADGVRMLGWTDDEIELLEEDPLIPTQWIPNDELPGIDEYVMPDETFLPVASYPVWATEETPKDAVYDLLEVLWDNRETLADENAAFQPWLDGDFWTSLFTPELPVHPGTAEFYQEVGIWSDEFEVADIS